MMMIRGHILFVVVVVLGYRIRTTTTTSDHYDIYSTSKLVQKIFFSLIFFYSPSNHRSKSLFIIHSFLLCFFMRFKRILHSNHDNGDGVDGRKKKTNSSPIVRLPCFSHHFILNIHSAYISLIFFLWKKKFSLFQNFSFSLSPFHSTNQPYRNPCKNFRN